MIENKIKVISTIILIIIVVMVLTPYNSVTHIETKNEIISKIERKSIINGGIYFTLGYYDNFFELPKTYIKPEILDSGFDSYFELVVEVTDNDLIFYNWGSNVKIVGDDLKKKFKRPDDFNHWSMMKSDTTGLYMYFH